jgi:alginate O-acetyltransferase complex protein AlgI
LYFGLIVLIEKYTILRIADRIPRFVQHLYCLFLVVLGWGLFYYDDLGAMGKFLSSLFGHTESVADISVQSALLGNFWLWFVAIFFCMPVRQLFGERLVKLCGENTSALVWTQFSLRLVISIIILVMSVALLVGATNNAFIYTRF